MGFFICLTMNIPGLADEDILFILLPKIDSCPSGSKAAGFCAQPQADKATVLTKQAGYGSIHNKITNSHQFYLKL
jgi:hypothetical protein